MRYFRRDLHLSKEHRQKKLKQKLSLLPRVLDSLHLMPATPVIYFALGSLSFHNHSHFGWARPQDRAILCILAIVLILFMK